MNKAEQKRYAENFLKRRTSRIVSAQSGYNDQLVNFADPYEHDTLADTADGSTDAPDTTTRVDVADVGNPDFDGKAPGAIVDDSDITGAISIIQKHIASLGSDDLLDKWASTAEVLKKSFLAVQEKLRRMRKARHANLWL